MTRDPLRDEIMARDRMCVLALYDPDHVCRDQWGDEHPATATDRLTLEHVKDALMMGRRAPSDPAHLVALCAYTNIAVPSKAQRVIMREHLRRVNDAVRNAPV